jgi:hypothetical protein
MQRSIKRRSFREGKGSTVASKNESPNRLSGLE